MRVYTEKCSLVTVALLATCYMGKLRHEKSPTSKKKIDVFLFLLNFLPMFIRGWMKMNEKPLKYMYEI